jgi:phage portal protein BeeE
MFDKFKSMLKMSDSKKSQQATKSYQYQIGSVPSYHGSWTYDFAKGMAYDNVYPSISKIVNEFINIRPYAIDANGKPIEETVLLNKIYHPNQKMSSADFREALAVCALTHRKVYLLVWHYENGALVAGGGGITPENIAGFTFIEGCVVIVDANGRKTYKSSNLKYEYTEDDVIEIYAGIDPYDLDAGYSPTQAVAKWANIDDFIANYEAGHFENGAVPAGQFIITAPTAEAFNDIVDSMQKKFRGSGNNNNVAYVHRPIQADTGAVQPAQIEWIPFAQSNKDMSLDTIFKQVNDKIDSTYGVPASVRGVNENKGYASVRIDQQIFIRYTVKPFATKIWTRFTHEMNRITGGLGFAITFDLDIPNIADEEKVEAETKKIEADIISQMLDRGYSLNSICDAFEFSNARKLLVEGKPDDGEIVNDKPDVDEGEEVSDSPEIAVVKGCTHNHDEIHKSADKNVLKELRQLLNDYFQSVIDATLSESGLAKKDISAVGLEQYDLDGDGLINEYEAEQIPIPEPSDEKKYLLVMALLALLLSRMKKSGEKRYQDTIIRFGITITIPELQHYSVSEQAQKEYEKMLTNIGNSYTDQIVDAIRNTIQNTAKQGGATAKDLKEAIKKTLKENEWRIERIANTEEHRADNLGQVDAVKELGKATGKQFGLKWKTTSAEPCAFCQYMNGTIVKAGEAFVPLGGKIESDDAVYLNDYENMMTPNAHPNCKCVFDVVEL